MADREWQYVQRTIQWRPGVKNGWLEMIVVDDPKDGSPIRETKLIARRVKEFWSDKQQRESKEGI